MKHDLQVHLDGQLIDKRTVTKQVVAKVIAVLDSEPANDCGCPMGGMGHPFGYDEDADDDDEGEGEN